MSLDVAVVADDLTGAGDTAVQFTRAGWVAELQLRPGTTRAQVVAVTTDSRACSEQEAAERVRSVVGGLVEAGPRHLYKKIDSTLRGPVRAEVEALLSVLGPEVVAVVCPAFPAVGRTLRDGTLLVHGRPVAETPAGTDPVTPVSQSHLPTLLGAPLVRLSSDGSLEQWAAAVGGSGPVVVVDAEDDDDLDRLARAVVALGDRAVAVGSAGLAEPLARHWNPRDAVTTLVVVTSLHEASRQQADALAGSGAVRHQPTDHELLDDDAWSSFVVGVLDDADRTPRTLLLTAPEPGHRETSSALVAERLAQASAAVLRRGTLAGLVLTGGDGARAVFTALDASGIRLHGQVEAGIPLGELVGGWAAGLSVATKAGGFGAREALITAAEAVRLDRSSL